MSKSNRKTNENKLLEEMTRILPYQAKVTIDAMNDFVLPGDWGFRNRVNLNYHLAFVKSGGGHYEYDGKQMIFQQAKIFMFGKNCPHSRFLNQDQLPRMTLVRFDVIDLLTGEQSQCLEDGLALEHVTNRPGLYYELFERCLGYYKEESSSAKVLAELTLTQIIHEMYRDTQTSVRLDPRLENVCDYIRHHYSDQLRLEDMVRISGLSRNYFLTLFKEAYGVTPKQYQIRYKIDQASKYISETDLKIGTISEMLGYKDQFSFSKQFKEVTGLRPSSLRKTYIEPGMV